MRLPSFIGRALDLMERAIDAMVDPTTRQRTILGLLTGYTVLWTLVAAIAKAPLGMPADPAEIVVLSRALDWGGEKHPPLLPALAGLWFTIFPQWDIFYHLLAVTMGSAAIYVTWLLAGLWLDREKQAAVPFLMMLIPSTNFMSLKFDHNTTQTLFWALVTYAFVRSLRSRDLIWSAVTGVTVAAALLAKYWAAVLVAGLAVAALLDRRRALYFTSPAPWIAGLVTAAILTPHVVWLYRHEFSSAVYATRLLHTDEWIATAALRFIASPFAYSALVLILFAALVPLSRPALIDIVNPQDHDRRFAVSAFLAPFGVAILGAIFFQLHLSTLWTASMLALFPVVLLSSPLVAITRRTVAGFAAAGLTLTLGALCAAPFVAIASLRSGGEYDSAHMRNLAVEAERAWRDTTDRPLRLVAGPAAHAHVVAYYLADRPLSLTLFPRLNRLIVDPGIARDGFVVVCPANDRNCADVLMQFAPAGRPAVDREVTSTPSLWGLSGPPRRFIIRTVGPKA